MINNMAMKNGAKGKGKGKSRPDPLMLRDDVDGEDELIIWAQNKEQDIQAEREMLESQLAEERDRGMFLAQHQQQQQQQRAAQKDDDGDA